MKTIGRTALLIGYFAIFVWLDWIMHRQEGFVIFLILFAAYMLFIAQTRVAPQIWIRGVQISPLSDELAAAIYVLFPPLYFLIRGSGTSGVGLSVAGLMILVAISLALLGPILDRLLLKFYEARNRRLPRVVAILLAIIIPILLAFIVVHGSLWDIVALFGGTTRSPQTPSGLSGRFYFTVVVSAILAYLLLRQPGEETDGSR